jgi:hypothetical protein
VISPASSPAEAAPHRILAAAGVSTRDLPLLERAVEALRRLVSPVEQIRGNVADEPPIASRIAGVKALRASSASLRPFG